MANQSFLNDPKHWRDRAEEARTRADQLDDPQSKSAMLRIANDYESRSASLGTFTKIKLIITAPSPV